MPARTHAIAAIAVTLATTAAHADLLWDNNLTPNGFNGRALSPPNFPDIRVADDVHIPPDERWTIEGFGASIIEDAGWTRGEMLELFIYEDEKGMPGAQIIHVTAPFDQVATGDEYFQREAFEYSLSGLHIELDGGNYWIGLRNPEGAGSGTNYWLTSDGGPDGKNSSTGYFSVDGVTWTAEGEGWHHAFALRGVPEPTTLALLAVGAAIAARRRRTPG